MKKRPIWISFLAVLVVVALVLASCGPAEEGEEVEEKEEATTTGPQYGGWVNEAPRVGTPSFDPNIAIWLNHPVRSAYDPLIAADWSKGLGGTKEYTFNTGATVWEYTKGMTLESWEQTDPTHYILKVRKGIHFWEDKAPAYGREMDAYDLVYSWEANTANPRSWIYAREKEFKWTALDKWTIEVSWENPDTTTMPLFYAASSVVAIPREVKDLDWNWEDYKNAVGTGPFIPVDFVPGTSVALERNPNYWEHDPQHPENQLPYVDGVNLVYMTDLAAKIAALRTGKIDRVSAGGGIPWTYVESLNETNPELLHVTQQGSPFMMYVRCDLEPWKDIRVRHAAMLAIDQPGILEDYYMGNGEILWEPSFPQLSPWYITLEELPTDVRELFEYHPDKARDLLTEAGYPTGFETEIMTSPAYQEVTELYAGYLKAVGIDAKINVLETAVHSSLRADAEYEGLCASGTSAPQLQAWNGMKDLDPRPPISYQGAIVDDVFSNLLDTAIATTDPTEQLALWKEAGTHALNQVWAILGVAEYPHTYWQPWIKNYHGEFGLILHGQYPLKYVWIDQDLKSELTE